MRTKITGAEQFRELSLSVYRSVDDRLWNVCVLIKKDMSKLNPSFTIDDICTLTNEELAPYIAHMIMEDSIDQ